MKDINQLTASLYAQRDISHRKGDKNEPIVY
jgi:hypothetical protein